MAFSAHWLIPGDYPSYKQLGASNLASVRLRCSVALNTLDQNLWRVSAGDSIEGRPDVLMIGKIGADCRNGRATHWLAQASKLKSLGVKIIVDYTDHHLGFVSPMGEFYREILQYADECVVPSDYMRIQLQKLWAGNIQIVHDAIEIDVQSCKNLSSSTLALLWFGHASNVSYLVDFLNAEVSLREGVRIVALTNSAGAEIFKRSITNHHLQYELGLWSVDTMLAAAQRADLCIIPSDLSDAKKMGASSNRLITALALGLPTAATRLASYTEFDDYFVDLNSPEFLSMLAAPSQYLAQTKKAQTDVVPQFLREHIGAAWFDYLSQVVKPGH